MRLEGANRNMDQGLVRMLMKVACYTIADLGRSARWSAESPILVERFISVSHRVLRRMAFQRRKAHRIPHMRLAVYSSRFRSVWSEYARVPRIGTCNSW